LYFTNYFELNKIMEIKFKKEHLSVPVAIIFAGVLIADQ
jgi:hypothetical protein